LFPNLVLPTEAQVGHIVSLSCGHTSRLTDIEAMIIALHLEAAGFIHSKGPMESPNRMHSPHLSH